ncbi:hypothetical protein ABIB57_003972 [Devosia sp. UYZn731]|uniref:type II toxin-antitoxin system RelB family antitoxin n=1 Tax=Devosia sp. UYZn731 TaxID=3156345 RepID=UPI003398434A
MTKKLDPIISEFETQEQADSYDKWFREQVRASIADKRPGVPHDEAMARIRKAIREAAKKSA